MDGEQAKQANNYGKVPPTQLNQQMASDLTLAITLQEQERTFLRSIMDESENEEFSEEEEEEEEEEYDDEHDDDGDAEAEANQYYGIVDEEFLEADVLYPEEESGSNDDEDDMSEDEIDPDDMSYEELLALGEAVGIVNKGLSTEEVANSLRPYENNCKLKREDGVDRCVICQDEYEEGESLVMLPCDHPFHSDCISRWLQMKKVCPICSSEVSSSTL